MKHWGGKPTYQRIDASETKAGRRVSRKPARASIVFVLLLCTITWAALVIVGQFINFHECLFVLIGAWSAIAASETDANSPLNQTLMDKFRGNMDYLYDYLTASGAYLKFLNGTDISDTDVREIVLDDTVDYLNRYVTVTGIIVAGNAATAAAAIPGGADDNYISSDAVVANFNEGAASRACLIVTEKFLFTESGDDAGDGVPRVSLGTEGELASCYLFADSADGALHLRVDCGTSGFRNIAWNLKVTYSEPQI
jgi:hypothetical protein